MSVTCVITTHNDSEHVRDAVESVLAQTAPPAEIIIADDASTDGTIDVIRAIAADHSHVRAILRTTNVGPGANRDLALREATCEYVTYLDGDDLFLPTKIEAELRAIVDKPGHVAFSNVRRVAADGTTTLSDGDISQIEHIERSVLIEELASRRKARLARNILTDRMTYVSSGGFSHKLRMMEDWHFAVALAVTCAGWTFSGVLGYGYRQHPQSHTRTLDLRRRLGAQPRFVLANRRAVIDNVGYAAYGRVLAANAYKATVQGSARLRGWAGAPRR